MDPKRYPRRGKIRRKSRNRKNINTKNIHFIDTSLLLPPILLSYHIKTCLFFVRIIFGHHRCTSSRHTHIFRLSTCFVYRLYIHIIVKFTRFPHNIIIISIHSHFPVVAYTPRRGRRNLAQGKMSVANDTLGSKGRAKQSGATPWVKCIRMVRALQGQ